MRALARAVPITSSKLTGEASLGGVRSLNGHPARDELAEEGLGGNGHFGRQHPARSNLPASQHLNEDRRRTAGVDVDAQMPIGTARAVPVAHLVHVVAPAQRA